MAGPGLGAAVDAARARIREIRAELDGLGEHEALPEALESANLVRANDRLARSGRLKSDLIEAYEGHAARLEALLASLLEIQEGLREVVRGQSELIGARGPARGAARRRAGGGARRRRGAAAGRRRA